MAFSVSYLYKAVNAFSGPARKIAASARKIKKDIDSTSRSMGLFSRKSRQAKSDLKGLIGQAAGLIATTVSFTEAAKSAIKFEDTLAEVSAITGATGADLGFLKEQAFILGKESANMGDQVLTAFKLVASAKPELLTNLPALKDVTREVLKLKNASGTDLANAAKVTAESLNLFGKDASQAARFVNVLAAGSKFGSSEVEQTGQAILKSGAAASFSALRFEELNSLIQGMAKSGIKAEQAGTGLNAILTKLEASGIPQLSVKTMGLNTVLETLDGANLTAAQSVKLFGLENIKSANAIIANRKFIADMTGKLAGTDVAAEQAAIRLATMSAKARVLGATLQQKVVAIADKLVPTITILTAEMTNFVDNLGTEDINIFVDSMKAVLLVVQKIGQAISVMIKGLKFAADLLGQVAAATVTMDLTQFDAGGLMGRGRDILGSLGNLFSVPEAVNTNVNTNSKSDVNIKLTDPGGAVESIATQASPNTNLNVGKNIAAGGAL